MRHLLFFSVVCLVVACGGRQQRQPDTTVEPAHMPRVFLPAIPPSRLTAEETTEWMRWHYWDKFDFADTLFIAEIDTAQMVQAYARYIFVALDETYRWSTDRFVDAASLLVAADARLLRLAGRGDSPRPQFTATE